MLFRSKTLSAACAAVLLQIVPATAQSQRNLILFVPDGLRPNSVTPETAPTLAAVRDKGVNFINPHSLFPTFTMANASGMATGHFLGDTGAFSNTIYTAYPVPSAGGSVTPFIENDPILGDIDAHFSGNFVDEDTILFAARRQGLSTAGIGKLGPTLMFDHTERTGDATITVDDSTGSKQGIPLSQEMQDALKSAGLPLAAPSRKDTPGDNSNAGNFEKPGTLVANIVQQKYFADVAAKVVLPMFKARNKPFVLVFWSRDPDGTQHNQGDSHLKVSPGINGPTSLASVKNADDNLADLRKALDELGLAATTDIVVAADHGFSTISKESKTSPAAQADRTQRKRAGERAEVIIDEETAHVILREQEIDHPLRERVVFARQVNKIGATVCRRDHIRLRWIVPDHPVSTQGLVSTVPDRRILRIGIVQRQAKFLGEVDREESGRQEPDRNIIIGRPCGSARFALLGYRRETVVRRYNNICCRGKAELIQRFA